MTKTGELYNSIVFIFDIFGRWWKLILPHSDFSNDAGPCLLQGEEKSHSCELGSYQELHDAQSSENWRHWWLHGIYKGWAGHSFQRAAYIFLHLGRLSLRLSKRWNQFSKRNCQWSAAHHAWHRKIVVYLIWQHCKDLEWNYGDDIISWLFSYGSWLWI